MSVTLFLPVQRGFALIVALSLVLGAMVPLMTPAPIRAASTTVVISQVYGGGGNSGAPYTHDFVELFNLSDEAVHLDGLSIQYASATGTGNFGSTATQLTELSGSIPAGGYFLVEQGGGTNGVALPSADLVDSTPIAMAAGAGKVALVTGTDSLGCNGGSTACNADQLARIVDLVGYGGANFFEGAAAAPTLNNTTSAHRADGGCTDTDDNAADFTAADPAPRNSASPVTLCGGGEPQPTDPTGIGSAEPSTVEPGGTTTLSVTLTPGTNPTSTGIAVTADLTPIGGSSVQVFADGGDGSFAYEATVGMGVEIGPKTITATITDEQERTGTATIELTVSDGAAPAGGPVVISQVYGGGGNSGATYTHDFVELYNRTDASVSLAGWSVQYASATGSSWTVTALGGSIEPGGHYLVQQAQGAGGTTPLPTPDASGGIAMAAANGKVALVSSSTALAGTCPLGEPVVDFVGFGSTASCFEGDGPTRSLSNTTAALRLQDGAVDTDDNAADFTTGAPTPRNGGDDGGGTPPDGGCGNATHFIHEIQGTGPASPIAGQDVTVEAVVVGNLQGPNPALGGFFLQSRDDDADDDVLTSEGIFVFSRGFGVTVAVGDVVAVTGTVAEFNNMTQISSVLDIDVCATGASVTPVEVTLPVDNVSDWERWEGMLATFTQSMTVTENFSLGRFGELVLSSTGRQYQGTHSAEPGADAAAVADLNARTRIILDDANTSQNADPTRYPAGGLSAANTLRIGATTAGLTAVVHEGFGAYRLQPLDEHPITFDGATDRPERPPEVGGRIQVAAFNVLNYFNGDGAGGGWDDPNNRGANSPFEFDRQRTKIIEAIAAMDAEVVGLMEIENDDSFTEYAAIEDLVDGLNDLLGTGTYDFVETGVIGTDAIAVAIIYQPGEVEPLGDHAILDSSVDPAFDDERNRPVLAQTFTETATGSSFTVAVNHLKSKGSGCGPGDDQPDTSGGNCNGTRTAAAAALATWLETDPTGAGDSDVLIIGDLNSYAREDPIDELIAAGYTDLLDAHVGSDAYTYVFMGASGYLDHGLSSETMTEQVTGADAWHINTDEPPVLDYNVEFKSANHVETLYAPDAYRSSDHDPVLIGLDLHAAPVITSLEVTELAQVGAPVGLSATYTDANLDESHTATVDWGDGTVETVAAADGAVEATHVYTTAGLYTVTLTVTDEIGLSDSASFRYAVVFDPDAGFVTGGGRISTDDRPGSFGISIAYRGQGTNPTGDIGFSLPGLEVASTSFDWLVVDGSHAWLQASASVNGETGYQILVAGTDAPDRLRLRLTDASGDVIFDNQPGDPDDAVATEPILNGQIRIHVGTGSGRGAGSVSALAA